VTNRDGIRVRIYSALETLVQTKALSEVKVIELCQLSGVPRSTFYTYFCDIYSIPQSLWDDLMQPTLYRIGDKLTWDQGHRYMFENLLKHKTLFTKIYWENGYNSILEYGYRGAYLAFKKNVEDRKKYNWSEYELVELDYTIKALASLTTKWGRDGMVVPIDHIVKIFNSHVPPFLKDLCDK
jgi:hypothetical protein